MKSAWKEITELSGKETKSANKLKRERRIALGSIEPKQGKIPFKALMLQKKQQKAKQLKIFEKNKEMFGVAVAKQIRDSADGDKKAQTKQYINELRGNRGGIKGTVGDGSRGFSEPGKLVNGGTLFLSKNTVSKMFQKEDKDNTKGKQNHQKREKKGKKGKGKKSKGKGNKSK
eukprot:TRINITY_DN3553_c0_g1_i2.p1 TRINITY_DN3553_c0_g1~~TRINITY_DN3553_c0_g1_i2.p1  ORF type:complete len:173 (+),score=50.60 TRINITY_DN3553_c0_g1_i2:178-696(+)